MLTPDRDVDGSVLCQWGEDSNCPVCLLCMCGCTVDNCKHKEVLLVLPYFQLVFPLFHRSWTEDWQVLPKSVVEAAYLPCSLSQWEVCRSVRLELGWQYSMPGQPLSWLPSHSDTCNSQKQWENITNSAERNQIRKRRDYVYGIWQYKVLSYKNTISEWNHMRGKIMIGKTWEMYKDQNKSKTSIKHPSPLCLVCKSDTKVTSSIRFSKRKSVDRSILGRRTYPETVAHTLIVDDDDAM